ncbi:MAG: non-ribosomal peptide synthetase, partial [Aphanocapsa sp. GSE-SYN-MK-11-07L]|nr:non-ribosomal peptide synthetase [Aphanocapsa sp. GSE-SYN-MK-11-07L]
MRYSAPQGVLTPDLKVQLQARKSEIIEFLKNTNLTSCSGIQPILPVPRDTFLPLSFAQQRLWFLQQLEPDNPFYNEHAALQLTGSLNVVALEQSLNKVVQRHEVLRTTFEIVEEQPVQIIVPNLPFTLLKVDLRHLPTAEQTSEVWRLAIQQSRCPFNLAQAPLWRWTLLQLSQSKYVLLFTIHHIVFDGWSIDILTRELSAFYIAFSTEAGSAEQGSLQNRSTLPELPIQYADFAVWQRQWLQGETLQSQLAYWQQQLDHAPSLLQLPTDRPRPPIQTYRGATRSFVLPEHLTQALKDIGKKAGATLFMTILAAFNVLLYRYTGQQDMIVGSPVANRNRAESEGLIGIFVNNLVLRTALSNDLTFEELLDQIREITIGGYANQDLPFEKLVEELQPERDTNYNPLFQVSFTLHNTPRRKFELPRLTIAPLEVESARALLDLRLDVTETDRGLACCWEYNTDLFESSTIARMAGHFQTLLTAIVANPQQQISEFTLLTES